MLSMPNLSLGYNLGIKQYDMNGYVLYCKHAHVVYIHWTCVQKVTCFIPSSSVLQQQHVKDPSHSAKGIGGRLSQTHIHSLTLSMN